MRKGSARAEEGLAEELEGLEEGEGMLIVEGFQGTVDVGIIGMDGGVDLGLGVPGPVSAAGSFEG